MIPDDQRQAPPSPIAVIVRHEFLTTVTSRSWLIATFGLPLFSAFISVIALLPTFLLAEELSKIVKDHKEIGVVAESPRLTIDPQGETVKLDIIDLAKAAEEAAIFEKVEGLEELDLEIKIDPIPSRAEAMTRLKARQIDYFVVVPEDWVETGRVEVVRHEGSRGGVFAMAVPPPINGWLMRKLMPGRSELEIRRVRSPAKFSFTIINMDGQELSLLAFMMRLGVPLGFTFLLFLAVFSSAGLLLNGIAEEKANRVMEVVLSSVTPDQLLWGKLLGFGGAGLCQIMIWGLVMAVPASALFALIPFRPLEILGCLFFFVLGFLLFGSLMLGFGALGTTEKESQTWSMVWSLIGILPLLFMPVVLTSPEGGFSMALTFFPFSAPVVTMMRMSLGAIALWEVLLSIAILVVSIMIAVKVSARVFRVGLLIYGKTPTPLEVWRALQHDD